MKWGFVSRASRRYARGLAGVPERLLDHARVVEEARVARSQAERLGHGGPRRLRLPVPVEGPREEVVRVDVRGGRRAPGGPAERRVELRVVVEVEGRELAIVERLVEQGEPPDVLDELVLAPRLVLPADPREEVAQGGDVVRLGTDVDRPPGAATASSARPCAARTWARPARARW